MSERTASTALVEHFFRHESGRLTASLVRRFGAARLELVEDAIQVALERALGSWRRNGPPDEPTAWLRRVATNHMIDVLRRETLAHAHAQQQTDRPAAEIHDGVEDTLTLLFACADERLAPRTRLVLCLKLLSGFSTEEIATRLFITRANVQKTLERGRAFLQQRTLEPLPSGGDARSDAAERLATVQLVLYLQFNEGYSFGPEDERLRTEICDEAIRLTRILVQHPAGDVPSTWALLALMHFHASRLRTRIADDGTLVPLDEQDRSAWDPHQIRLGLAAFQEATREDVFSRFHGEAAIQLEHALAPSFEATRWEEIAELYATLQKMLPSPLYVLNRAIALAEAHGAEHGLGVLAESSFPSWFKDHHLYQGTLGELYRRARRTELAKEHLRAAADASPSRAERLLFERRFAECADR